MIEQITIKPDAASSPGESNGGISTYPPAAKLNPENIGAFFDFDEMLLDIKISRASSCG